MKVGVLGASGFIGGHLIASLCESGYKVVGFSRNNPRFWNKNFCWFKIGDLTKDKSFQWLYDNDLDVIIDCSDPAVFSSKDNIQERVVIKRKLFQAAINIGISKYIYLSSIKVYAENSIEPINEFSLPKPISSYGKMKLAIETEFKTLAKTTNVDLTCVRLPLVYGKGGGRSIKGLAALIRLGIPLPLSKVSNSRSVISITNLCYFIEAVLKRPDIKNQDWFVSDLNPISTIELANNISSCLGLRIRLFNFPDKSLFSFLSLVGLKYIAFSLLGTLVIDDSHTRRLLDWVPSEFNNKDLCNSLEC